MIGKRTSRLAVAVAMASTALAPASQSAASAVDDRGLQAKLDRLTRDDGLPGAVAVVSGPTGSRELRSGVADIQSRRPMPRDGHFRSASNVKSMVSTVVLQLVGEGRISLDAPVVTYLPGVVPPKAGDERKITIRHLLQHTSGLYNFEADIPGQEDYQPYKHYSRAQFLDIGFAHGPTFEPPGTGWAYSNTGYVLLGMVIEKVTGLSWQEAIQRRVFARAGMRQSYFPAAYEYGLRAPHPRGYIKLKVAEDTFRLADVTDQDGSQSDANGAGVSTPGDLTRFYSALLGGRLLRPDLLAEMKKVRAVPRPPGASADGYGLGLGHFPLSCGDAWGNGGTTEGFQSVSAVLVDRQGKVVRTATIMVNSLFRRLQEAEHLNEAHEAALCGKA